MFPEHLDYHGSVEAYYEAKSVLAQYQTEDDVIFYNQDNEPCSQYVQLSLGKQFAYSNDDRGFKCALIGKHNHYNINAAIDVAKLLGVNDGTIQKALVSFKPLAHRLQDLGLHHNIRWINDSISTAPETCIAALKALGKDVETLIVGGVDRGIDYQSLADYIPTSSVKNLITIPDAGGVITSLMSGGPEVYAVQTLEEAVEVAKNITTAGKTCLLSPAAASYNHFKNFEVRGEAFEEYIKFN
jgi:UDP-N-acetylmuramoylalanine--D-glutamate ligase